MTQEVNTLRVITKIHETTIEGTKFIGISFEEGNVTYWIAQREPPLPWKEGDTLMLTFQSYATKGEPPCLDPVGPNPDPQPKSASSTESSGASTTSNTDSPAIPNGSTSTSTVLPAEVTQA